MTIICEEVVAQLRAKCPSLVTVEEAATMKPLESVRQDLPAVLVFLNGETAPSDAETTASRQRVINRYGFHVLVRPKDQRQVFAEIQAAMLGWVPDVGGCAFDEFAYHSGELNDIDKGYCWYVQQWRVPEFISADPSVNP